MTSIREQKGFTLIELVMVIVILGILAAFALPRFADLGGDARKATLEGAAGAVKSAAAIAHSKWLSSGSEGFTVEGNTVNGVKLDGTPVAMTTQGYPETIALAAGDTPEGIAAAAQIEAADFTLDAGGVFSIPDTAGGECQFTYDDTSGKVTGLKTDNC